MKQKTGNAIVVSVLVGLLVLLCSMYSEAGERKKISCDSALVLVDLKINDGQRELDSLRRKPAKNSFDSLLIDGVIMFIGSCREHRTRLDSICGGKK